MDRGDRPRDGTDGEGGAMSATLIRLIVDATQVLDEDRHAARTLLERAVTLLKYGASEEERKTRAAPNQAALTPWQAKRVTRHIEANLDRPLPIDELAGIAKLSNSYFSRAFKGAFGETPHAFIVCRRIERARQEMRDGGGPLSQIALSCGFADQAHLARTFRRATGLAPSEWRRANRAVVDRSRQRPALV